MDGLQDAGAGLLKGFDHLAGGDGEHPGQPGHEAAALDLHGDLLRPGEHAADGHFQLLRGAVADEDVVPLADVLDDRLAEGVAGHLDGGGLHDAGQGDHGDIGGAAADIHHHMAVGLGDIHPRADGGGQGLLDEVHPPGAGLDARVNDGALLHLGDAGGHADNHPGLEHPHGGHLADELPQHPFGHIVVGDNALPQGTDGHNVAGGLAQHLLGLCAHLEQLAGVLVQRHHRRLPQHNTLVLDIDQHAGGAQINADISCKHSFHSCV